MLTEVDGAGALVRQRARWACPPSGDPLDALRDTIAVLHTERLPGLPPLTGGHGRLPRPTTSVRRWERLPDANPDEIGVPELAMLLATDLAVLDHHDGSVLLIANAINYDDTDERVDDAWADAVRRLDAMQADLATQRGRLGRRRTTPTPQVDASRRAPTRADYLAGGRGAARSTSARATPSRSCCRSGSPRRARRRRSTSTACCA